MAGQRDVVVLEEGGAPGDAGRALQLEQPAHHLLGLVVVGMGLAGEDELHRPLAADQRDRALGHQAQQVQPLVGGQAAREADGQACRVEAAAAAAA